MNPSLHNFDESDRHELYTYIASLSLVEQETIKSMINAMILIVNKAPRLGRTALGALVLELTGMSVVDVIPGSKLRH